MTKSTGKQKYLQDQSSRKGKRSSGESSRNTTDNDFEDVPPMFTQREQNDDTAAQKKTPKKRVKCSTNKNKKSNDTHKASTSENKNDTSGKKKRKRQINPKGVKCKRRRIRKADVDNKAVEEEKYPQLNTRTTPAAFFKKLRDLNDAQRRAVNAIGFGRILGLTIKDVPSKLAYWVLDRYNSRNGYLEIDDTCKVKIEEDDVYRVFGFPKGDKKIKVFERTAVNELFNEWVAFFKGKSREDIKIKCVLEKMISCEDGGTWFIRHFMIAMSFSLMESCTSGAVHPYILQCLENVNELTSWNWGEFVISSLIDNKRSWINDQKKVFAGPTLFLMLFYVDRIEIHRQTNTRTFPVFVNWTSKKLREREAVEKHDKFRGGGCLLEPIELPAEYSKANNLQNQTNIAEGGTESEKESETETTASKFMKESFAIAARIEGLRALLRVAPESERQSKVLQDSISEGCKIMGINIDFVKSCREQENNDIDFDVGPTFYSEAFEVVDRTSAEILGTKIGNPSTSNDMPSFSLNMTQEFEDAANKDEEGVGMYFASDPAADHIAEVDGFENVSYSADKGLLVQGQYQNLKDAKGKACKDGSNIDKEDEALQVRRSKRVRGTLAAAASKEVLKDTMTTSGVGGGRKTNLGNHRTALKDIDPNIGDVLGNNEKTPHPGKFLKTIKFRSPYIQREICTVKPLKKAEKEIGMYALYLDTVQEHQILMQYLDVHVRRHEIISMRRGNVVNTAVMDAWSVLLNDKEKYRSNSSPLRFFATTSFYVESISPSEWENEEHGRVFYSNLTFELNEYGRNKLELIDLFFFPVYENEQYYALCVDIRRDKIYILDSMIDLGEEVNYAKYTRVCTKIRTLLANYLYSVNEDVKARSTQNSTNHIVRMKWADHRNAIDTGIYLMRHMETFMGDGSSSWKCNISNNRPSQLCKMRIRYCYSIITWENNDYKAEIQDAASNNYRELCTVEGLNVDLILLG